jgi:hypothetical protein
MVSDTFPFKKNLLKKIQLLSSLMDSNMKYLLFILGIKEQIDTITNSYNKWLYLFHISSC